MIIYELNVRTHGKTFDEIDEAYLRQLADIGIDWLWVMGIYSESPASREIFKRQSPDFEASPYALLDYSVNPKLGGEQAFSRFVERAHKVGLRVMVDFVANHMAIDSPLIDEHPEYFVHSDPRVRENERSEDYFQHRSGLIAYGRDPYFPCWIDTAQLDYTNANLRRHQIDVLCGLACKVDGIRCDMAMLVLRRQIKSQWYPLLLWEEFERRMPTEFWAEAIAKIKSFRRDFIFMAEVYWNKEAELQSLGFDLTYDKRLYDLLAHNAPPQSVSIYLKSCPNYYLSRCVHFLENKKELK
ncbi:MAG: alpha-amylase family glycosyl hydrolase [Acidobacteriota bacterium]|nr:alpha-amylase family glycosyl hydrolase [Blastocatellia bacterium]MDW8412113.1 alpha-amylase family glycosyl hydrolase [Acidobacteriota bacterium]